MELRPQLRKLKKWLGGYFPFLVRIKRLEYYANRSFRKGFAAYLRAITNCAYYAGVRTRKCPNDLWVYQEIIYQLKPTVIIEIGNFRGGSTLALADLQQRFSHGKVIGIDVNHERLDESVRNDKRIVWITGDAVSVFEQVRREIAPDDRVLIIEDSSHTYENTYRILNTYWTLVTPGSYFIVEDGTLQVFRELSKGIGTLSAIKQFLKENDNFEIDRSREFFVLTLNYLGFLKRKNC